tara:strand:+ start:194 stop:400 length:207 start_codon:yes stop_codon:yes gene_type:complete
MFCPDCSGRRFQKAQVLRRLRKCRREVPDQREVLTLIIRLIRAQAIECRVEIVEFVDDETFDEDETVH